MEGIANTIAKLKENIRNHMSPYNLGDEGKTTKLINELISHIEQPKYGEVWVKATVRMPIISKPAKLITVKRYEGVPSMYSVRAMTAAQFADIVKYDLANHEWLCEGTAAEREEVDSQELWDEFSEYISNDIDSCQSVAGSSVMTEASFKKAFIKFKQQKEG